MGEESGERRTRSLYGHGRFQPRPAVGQERSSVADDLVEAQRGLAQDVASQHGSPADYYHIKDLHSKALLERDGLQEAWDVILERVPVRRREIRAAVEEFQVIVMRALDSKLFTDSSRRGDDYLFQSVFPREQVTDAGVSSEAKHAPTVADSLAGDYLFDITVRDWHFPADSADDTAPRTGWTYLRSRFITRYNMTRYMSVFGDTARMALRSAERAQEIGDLFRGNVAANRDFYDGREATGPAYDEYGRSWTAPLDTSAGLYIDRDLFSRPHPPFDEDGALLRAYSGVFPAQIGQDAQCAQLCADVQSHLLELQSMFQSVRSSTKSVISAYYAFVVSIRELTNAMARINVDKYTRFKDLVVGILLRSGPLSILSDLADIVVGGGIDLATLYQLFTSFDAVRESLWQTTGAWLETRAAYLERQEHVVSEISGKLHEMQLSGDFRKGHGATDIHWYNWVRHEVGYAGGPPTAGYPEPVPERDRINNVVPDGVALYDDLVRGGVAVFSRSALDPAAATEMRARVAAFRAERAALLAAGPTGDADSATREQEELRMSVEFWLWHQDAWFELMPWANDAATTPDKMAFPRGDGDPAPDGFVYGGSEYYQTVIPPHLPADDPANPPTDRPVRSAPVELPYGTSYPYNMILPLAQIIRYVRARIAELAGDARTMAEEGGVRMDRAIVTVLDALEADGATLRTVNDEH